MDFQKEIKQRILDNIEEEQERLKKRNKALIYLNEISDLADSISYSYELAADKLDDGEKRNHEDGLEAVLPYVTKWRQQCEALEADLKKKLKKASKKQRKKEREYIAKMNAKNKD